MSLLPHLEVKTSDNPTHSVIWLHGLGADGHDFEDVVPALRLQDKAVRFIFPHAPKIPVTINGGMVMPAWYDITSIDINRTVDDAQLRASSKEVEKLIAQENSRGIDSENIILAGFSQGGAVVYETFLSSSKPLAGLMCLSTYLATANSVKCENKNVDKPILIHHGSQDPVVPELLGTQACEQLKTWGFKPEYKTYPMGHSLCIEQVKDIATWIRNLL